jgi:site-specific DNA-cytosine methylase
VRTKLLATFRALGYDARAILLNAKDFGVAQSRQRVFFVGTQGKYPPVLAIEPVDPRGLTVYRVLKDLPPPGLEGNEGGWEAVKLKLVY